MTENVRKIFDMLGVEPNERFKIDDHKYCFIYYIDENLIVRTDKTNFPSICNMLDILTGNVKIIKIPKYEFTKEEKNILKGLKLLKFNYIVRDEDGKLMAYTDKPEKNYTLSIWQYQFGEITYVNPNIFNFIKWKDSEPFKIPDFEDESEYETDEEKIKDKLKSISITCRNECDNLTCSECRFFVNEDCNYDMLIARLIENGFTFPKNMKETSEFPIEDFKDPEGSIFRK